MSPSTPPARKGAPHRWAPPPARRGGVPVTGLALRLNGTTTLPVAGNGAFAFGAIADGSAYSVAVFVQPIGQTCTVANASGTLAGANVTNVAVTCAINTHTIGGTVSGLSGT